MRLMSKSEGLPNDLPGQYFTQGLVIESSPLS